MVKSNTNFSPWVDAILYPVLRIPAELEYLDANVLVMNPYILVRLSILSRPSPNIFSIRLWRLQMKVSVRMDFFFAANAHFRA